MVNVDAFAFTIHSLYTIHLLPNRTLLMHTYVHVCAYTDLPFLTKQYILIQTQRYDIFMVYCTHTDNHVPCKKSFVPSYLLAFETFVILGNFP